MALTPKQQRFVEEYLLDLNATAAAIRAGYSKRGADKAGPHLLTIPAVKAAIDAAKLARSDRTQIDSDYVLQRLIEAVQADLADLYDANGDLLPVAQWPSVWRTGLVHGVDSEVIKVKGVEVGVVRKVRLADRTRLLELLGKHIAVGAFQEQVAVSAIENLGERLSRAKSRAAAALEQNRTMIDVTPDKVIAGSAERTSQALPGRAHGHQGPSTLHSRTVRAGGE